MEPGPLHSSVSKTLAISERLWQNAELPACKHSWGTIREGTHARSGICQTCPACTFHNLPSATHRDVCDEPLGATPCKTVPGVITPRRAWTA